jgi:hypothetical protein
MTTELQRVLCKASDYKICKKCKTLNWYENKICCDLLCDSRRFDKKSVLDYVENEYKFYTEEEGYPKYMIDNIEIEC